MTKKRKDRFADREARKYDHPISSRELIMEHLEQRKVPITLEELAEDLSHTDEQGFEGLRRQNGRFSS